MKDLKIPFKLEGITRIDDTPVHKALREALANCIVNTDFYLPRGIVIRKDADSIVMENPGSIRTGKEQMLKGGISDPRNKALMKMFNLIGIGERAGSGVPDIYSVWNDQDWREPEVDEQYNPDRTILKLPLVRRAKKTSEKSKRKKQAKKTGEIDEWLDLSEARTRVLLKEMADEGSIGSSGKTKKKEYYLLRKDV